MDAERGVFLVVDGVGGQAAGELAAQRRWRRSARPMRVRGSASGRARAGGDYRANNRIYGRARWTNSSGMACVLTLALVDDGRITIGHVGDSRLYLIWDGAIRKLTSDHSPVGEDEDAGALTEGEAMLHPRRNEVFRDVGSRLHDVDDDGFIEIRHCKFRDDAALLLCSDGLTDQLTTAQIRAITGRYDGDAGHVAAELVEAANEAGGKDNITALFVAGPKFRGSDGATRPRLRSYDPPAAAAAQAGRATGASSPTACCWACCFGRCYANDYPHPARAL